MADLVDFEVLLSQDERAPSADTLRQRDQRIASELRAGVEGAEPERRDLFLRWARKRRGDQFRGGPSPGEQVESFLAWTSVALVLAGLVLARGVVWSFFRSAESLGARPEPVNVFWFVAVCVVLPLAFTLYGFWLMAGLRSAARLPHAPALLRGSLLNLLRRPLVRLTRKVSDRSGPEKRLAAEAAWVAFRRRAIEGGNAVALKIANVAQFFGLSVTLGIVMFAAFDLLFHSRVFGWQSTAAVSSEAAHAVVRTIAAPWAWFLPEGRGLPNVQQLEATRFVRYQDPAGFPAQAATAWANFLVASVLVWSFLPRGVLYFVSRWQLRRALAAPDFRLARYDRLWERLTVPEVAIGAPTEAGTLEEALAAGQFAGGAEGTDCVLLMPEELFAPERQRAVADWLAARKQWRVRDALPLTPEAAAGLKDVRRAVIVYESFMPPVKAVLKAITEIRGAAPDTGLAVALVGKPSHEPLGAPPSRTDFDVWHAKLMSLGDPNLDFFSFREPQL